ncbi:DsbA family protein [Phenylobacterium sp. J367]|uniref:DsbA family protein n=1 Tax=Phenylobacterium sp. J367 TaxID=2898435 RepID=UPI0021512B2A|nr:DsbA family protein [Phenylobacterium sp. J367]MCR5877420.1 DsbA family protein [Phenylobacterium sp. J367]
MTIGDPKAPVHIVEYLSLTCPHCAHFNEESFPALKAKYIDTGQVRYTIRELLTQPAQVAAAGFIMARCNAAPPQRYFKVVDEVLRSQKRWQGGSIKPIFVEIAKANGMTEAQFEACLTDEKAQADLQARIEYAVNTDKVSGTPTFFVNGVKVEDVHSLAELEPAIARAKGGRR